MKWFLVRDPTDLEEPEGDHLTWLCQVHSTLATLYNLVQRFRRLLCQLQGQDLNGWITGCQASAISELAQFATGLLREVEWVVAGLTHSASQGPTEGSNTKLKLNKRAMYGRAGFPLLRHRVLPALEPLASFRGPPPDSRDLRTPPCSRPPLPHKRSPRLTPKRDEPPAVNQITLVR